MCLSPASQLGPYLRSILSEAARRRMYTAWAIVDGEVTPREASFLRRVQDLRWHGVIGEGSFGRVKLATLETNNESPRQQQRVAVKVMRKKHFLRASAFRQVVEERNVLRSLQHPFVAAYFGSCQDSGYVYLALEFLQGGELFSYLKGRRCSEDQARFYVAQSLLTLEYLHARSVVFRDLKPESLMLDAEGFLKFVDFHFAKQLDADTARTFTFCGSPEYLAPEIIQLKGHGVGVDWWTLGIFTFELILGGPPFQGAEGDVVDVYRHILTKDVVIPNQYRVSKDAHNLIRHLCHRDVTKRLGCTRSKAAGVKARRFFSGVDFAKLLRRDLRPPYVPRLTGQFDVRHFDVVDSDFCWTTTADGGEERPPPFQRRPSLRSRGGG
mmetsp:Transcript_16827/g.54777  ORF Transcript_16827/g.54777 Transcript_16827/m.54777 type:complete len:382 (-) Transcript_16827:97-1242(-)